MTATDIVLSILTIILLAYMLTIDYKKYRFNMLRRKMAKAIVNKLGCHGNIIGPENSYPMAYNCTLEKPEYVFTEESDDLMSRKIFITKDCMHIHALPWSSNDEFGDVIEDGIEEVSL